MRLSVLSVPEILIKHCTLYNKSLLLILLLLYNLLLLLLSFYYYCYYYPGTELNKHNVFLFFSQETEQTKQSLKNLDDRIHSQVINMSACMLHP